MLAMVSCGLSGLIPTTHINDPDAISRDFAVKITRWYQEPDGTLKVEFEFENISDREWQYCTIRFEGMFDQGLVFPDYSQSDVVPKHVYTGTAVSTYSIGEIITKVSPYECEIGY